MFKGKKGQFIFLGIMIAVMVFIVLVQLITPIKDSIVDARDADHLDCTNSTNSVGTKATCVIVDFSLFYFVGVMLAVAVGGIGGFAVKKIVNV